MIYTVKEVENDDYNVLSYVYKHPTLNNIENGIEYITNLGVNAITIDSKK